MASFKLCIAEPSTGKTFQKEVKDAEAQGFLGLNIGEKVQGGPIGMEGYEFSISGGSDFCGFPMRRGILGVRKKITAYGGIGFPHLKKGMRKRKTVCGHKINDKISQINLKVLKVGAKPLLEIFPPKEGEKKEDPAIEDKK
ncbi:30S ribosomal protein S6e [Candidatus Woesearchaeota archaeon]|nr:30S ribosomal protein S6e [Candidatus Woesearchaeota archaeon]